MIWAGAPSGSQARPKQRFGVLNYKEAEAALKCGLLKGSCQKLSSPAITGYLTVLQSLKIFICHIWMAFAVWLCTYYHICFCGVCALRFCVCRRLYFLCTRVKLLAASGTERRPLRKHILRCSLVRATAKTNICRLPNAFFVIISGAAYQQQITELDEESLALQQSCTPDPF